MKSLLIGLVLFFSGVWVGSAFTDIDALAVCVSQGRVTINDVDIQCQLIRTTRT